jgi:hypothetical protein
MKRLLSFGLLMVFSTPLSAMAQSPFDGTWIISIDGGEKTQKPDVYLLQNGVYRCPTCDPPLEIKADGQDHKVAGTSCYDTASIAVVDDRTTLETDKRNGKTAGTSRITVSPDGNTATRDVTESCNAKGDVVAYKTLIKRVAKGPEDSHAISGSWQFVKDESMSRNALVVTFKLTKDTFYFADPTDQHFTAKLDGTPTPIVGDLSGTVVSVKRIDENTIDVALHLNGKIVETWSFNVSPDGRTLTLYAEDKVKGSTDKAFAQKQ